MAGSRPHSSTCCSANKAKDDAILAAAAEAEGIEEEWVSRVGRAVGTGQTRGACGCPTLNSQLNMWLLHVAPGLLLKPLPQGQSPPRKVTAGVGHDATRTSFQAASSEGRAPPLGGGR